MNEKDTYPKSYHCTVIDDSFTVDSVKELNERLAAYKFTDMAVMKIKVAISAINKMEIPTPPQFENGGENTKN